MMWALFLMSTLATTSVLGQPLNITHLFRLPAGMDWGTSASVQMPCFMIR